MTIYEVETISGKVFVATIERTYEYMEDYLKDFKASNFCDEQGRKISKKKALDLCEWRSVLNEDRVVYIECETILSHCDFVSISKVEVLE